MGRRVWRCVIAGVELVLNVVRGGAGSPMVFARLFPPIIWNVGTWTWG